MNMTKREILLTRVGELLDMMSCARIMNGRAKQKKKYSLQDIINM